MFKKIASLLLVAAMVVTMSLAFTSCGKDSSDFKVGFICLHDENSTYDLNFINAAKAAQSAMGLTDEQVIIKTNIPEGDECYQTALDLVDQGCDVVFADSFGHEEFMIKAAKENPSVMFCHATGTQAKVVEAQGVKNYHNAFASIYEGRFLAGVAAGMKLNEMVAAGTITADQCKLGYVGAFTYAEVISGYTSFFLGARYACDYDITMEVTFTGSWFDINEEKNGAEKLISDGCVLISQHADSMGAPSACEAANVPDVSYNGSTADTCPNTFIVSSKINWQPYFEKMITAAKDGTALDTDWCGTLTTDSVQLTAIGEKAPAAGTAEKIEEVKAKLVSGELKVFDVNTFTVTVTDETNTNATVDENGHLTAYMADVDGDYKGDTNVVHDGYFDESGAAYRSAPFFDIQIDDITLLNAKF